MERNHGTSINEDGIEISINEKGTYVDEKGKKYAVNSGGYVLRRVDNAFFNSNSKEVASSVLEPAMDFENSYIHVGGRIVPINPKIAAEIRKQQSPGGSPLTLSRPKRNQ